MTEIIRQLISNGKSYSEISKITGRCKSTINYHAKKLRNDPNWTCNTGANKRYDWTVIQEYYNLGHSMTDCVTRFGFSRSSWSKAVNSGRIKTRDRMLPIEELLIRGKSRKSIKKRLIDAGILAEVCSICNQPPEWNGRPLVMVLDHINGKNNDYRIENLRLVCPHCNSQLGTFAGRNTAKAINKRNTGIA